MKKQDQTLIIVAVVVIAFVLVAQNRGLNVQMPNPSNPNIIVNVPQNNNTQQQQQSNSLAASSLYASVSPDPVRMGQYVYGSVIGNGYNVPITIYAKSLGEGTQQSFGGMLDATGHFDTYQQLNTPGYYQFWAEGSGGVKSNIVALTCTGVRIGSASDHYSKSFSDSMLFKLYSNLHGNAALIANDAAHSVSYPVTNCVVNSNGYGEIGPSLDFLPNGTYEIDVVLGGQKASDFSASCWITIGR